MDRAKFYNELRKTLIKSFNQDQVKCMELILDKCLEHEITLDRAAYCFGTAWHETGQFRWLREIWGPTAQQKKYEPGTSLAKQLGNTVKGDGKKFMGRGFVHITGRTNYADWSNRLGVDLINKPELAEIPEYAAEILVLGMKLGTFTGKDLDDYIDELDESDSEELREYKNARRIVNGTDKADLIAGYALKFEKALKAAKYDHKAVKEDKTPFKEAQKPAEKLEDKSSVVVPEKKETSQKASLWETLFNLFFLFMTGTERKK